MPAFSTTLEQAVPRDRNGSFEPVIVPKGERRLDGFDDRILSLYASGKTVREIQGHLHELYGVEVSPDMISRVPNSGHWLLTWYGLFLSGPRFFHQAYKHPALLWPILSPRLH